MSYSAWSEAFKKHTTQYDYYIFNEDDYFFIENNWDRYLTNKYNSYPDCGYLCPIMREPHYWNQFRKHAGHSVGIASTKNILKLKNGLPHSTPTDYTTTEEIQKQFSFSFLEAGLNIYDIRDDYRVAFAWTEDDGNDIWRFFWWNEKDLIQPAIDMAREGFKVTNKQAIALNLTRKLFEKANNYKVLFDKEWKKGALLKQEELAQTLERIRDHGQDGFYKGKTAQLFVDYVKELGGIISLEDLEKYKAIWRKPIEFNYKNHKIISMTLPASGGICLAQILKSIEPFDLTKIAHNSSKYVQLLTEAERRSYADRAHYLGDIDFINVPIDSLIATLYIKKRMNSFNWNKATKSSEVSHGAILGHESDQTTHYSIVDQFGNAVSVTTTLNTGYGSKVLVKGAGFFLNNEMDDFSAKPGAPNVYGLVGSKANAIAPEKRMLSSMTPTIVEKDGKLKMVLGTPGGSTIITSVLQNIINIVDYKMGMQESVNKARFHHQWLPDNIRMESNGFDSITKGNLTALGYELVERNSLIIGRVDAILLLPNGKLEGGADPRGDDKAVGF